MRERILLFAGVLGVACTCGPSGEDAGGCDINWTEPDGSYYGGYGGWGGTGGYGGSLGGFGGSQTCPSDAGGEWVLTDGGCVLIGCAAGRADCDGVPGNGCETQLDSDASHCGACSEVCDESACTFGSCQGPEVVFAPSNKTPVTAMTSDGQTVYFAAGNNLYAAAADGSSNIVASVGSPVRALAASASHVVMAHDTSLDLVALGASPNIYAAVSFVGDSPHVAVDDGYAYLAARVGLAPDAGVDASQGGAAGTAGSSGSAGNAGQSGAAGSGGVSGSAGAGSDAGPLDAWVGPSESELSRIDLVTGTLEPVASGLGTPTALELSGGVLYAAFSTPSSIVAMPTQTLQPVVIASGSFDVRALSVDGGFVYFSDVSTFQILRAPIAGGAPELVSLSTHAPFDLHVDGGEIFVATTGPAELWRLLGWQADRVAGLLEPNVRIALDDQYMWWAYEGGGLLRAPR